jgi:hypothetical protein
MERMNLLQDTAAVITDLLKRVRQLEAQMRKFTDQAT